MSIILLKLLQWLKLNKVLMHFKLNKNLMNIIWYLQARLVETECEFPSWVQRDLESDFANFKVSDKEWDFEDLELTTKISDLFNLIRPRFHSGMTFDGIASQINQVYVLEAKTGEIFVVLFEKNVN